MDDDDAMDCPRCDGSGTYNLRECSLCEGYGRLDGDCEPLRFGEKRHKPPSPETVAAFNQVIGAVIRRFGGRDAE